MTSLEEQRQLSLQFEQEREARRQRSRAFLQQLALSPQGRTIFAQLPQSMQETFTNAVGEPISEATNMRLDSPQVQGLAQRVIQTAPPPSAATGIQMAQLGASAGVPDLFQAGLSIIDPELGATVTLPDGQQAIDPAVLNKLLGDTSILTPQSKQAFWESYQAGDPDFTLLEADPALVEEAGGSLPDVVNLYATRAAAKLSQGQADQLEPLEIVFLRKKAGEGVPGMSESESFRAIMMGLGPLLAIEAFKTGGMDVDKTIARLTPIITKLHQSVLAAGLPSNAATTGQLTSTTAIRIARLESPQSFDAEMAAIKEEVRMEARARGERLTEEQVIQLTTDKIAQLIGVQ
jgi:hypothetical protein